MSKTYIEREELYKHLVSIYKTAELCKFEVEKDVILKAVEYQPSIEVVSVQEVNEKVYEALRILNALNSLRRLDYGTYCELHDVISAILCD